MTRDSQIEFLQVKKMALRFGENSTRHNIAHAERKWGGLEGGVESGKGNAHLVILK